jgi:hypothetical protein
MSSLHLLKSIGTFFAKLGKFSAIILLYHYFGVGIKTRALHKLSGHSTTALFCFSYFLVKVLYFCLGWPKMATFLPPV